MSTEAQAEPTVVELTEPVTPDIPVTDDAAVTPEVADQEAEQKEAEPTESVEDRLKRLEREAHALRRRNEKLAAKHRVEAETAAQYRARLEQIHGAQNQAEVTPETIEQAMRERVSHVERETEAVVTIKSLAKSDPKFIANLNALAEEAGSLMDQRGLPTPLLDQIMECDKPTKVAAYLAKNPDVAAELEGLSPTRLAKRLLLIETGMSAPPKVSNAPEPIKPIGQRGRGTTVPLEDLPMDEYIAARRKQGNTRY